ncbi:2-oxoglutarate oxidoreductase subunit KorB [bacterium HR39]|nr:2-oxoglutarate oxidoreductase subunit KorB [bacterium HR39]
MLSIGTNHLIHTVRRDPDLVILILDNEVYGLTKGQISPTSPTGMRTPSTPRGSVERPLSALQVALAAGARFVARAIDTDRELPEILVRAHDHPGTAVVQILQNCVVYNDGAFEHITAKEVAADAQLRPVPGEPLVFGRERDRALRVGADGRPEVVSLSEVDPDTLPRFDPKNRELACLLAALEPPLPVAIGVLYADPAPESYERAVRRQEEEARAQGPADLAAVLKSGPVWVVPG